MTSYISCSAMKDSVSNVIVTHIEIGKAKVVSFNAAVHGTLWSIY